MFEKRYLIHILFFLVSYHNISQTSLPHQNHHSAFDSIIGVQNIQLYNGLRYYEQYRNYKDNHQYFNSSNYLNGEIKYFNQSYYDLNIKYDLVDDLLIVKLYNNRSFFDLQLNSKNLHWFKIDNYSFENLGDVKLVNSNIKLKGFFELFFQGKTFKVLVKHKKTVKKNIEGNTLKAEFKNELMYLVLKDEKLFLLSSKKDLNIIFPENNKLIRKFFKNYRRLLKTNEREFYNKLFLKINNN